MKKTIKVLLSFLSLIIAIYCIQIDLYWIATILVGIWILYFMNKRFVSELNNNCINFMRDKRRNFDTIIIGKPPRKEKEISTNTINLLKLTNTKRSFFASYLILIHYYSYLREDGKGIIYIFKSKKNEENYVTIYDWIHFHPVIKSKLKLNNQIINRLPLFFYFRKFKVKDFFIDKADLSIEERILIFCQERNLNIKIIIE